MRISATLKSLFPIFLLLAGCFVITLFSNFMHWSAYQQHRRPYFEASFINLPDLQNKEDDFAHVFLYYPLEKTSNKYTVYLNRKSIGSIRNGGRIDCRLLLEGPVAVTIVEGNQYREPLTQSRNSRTISIKKGKSYYFHINGSGELEYLFIAAKGEKNFAEAKDFTENPITYSEPSDGTIPPLSDVHN